MASDTVPGTTPSGLRSGASEDKSNTAIQHGTMIPSAEAQSPPFALRTRRLPGWNAGGRDDAALTSGGAEPAATDQPSTPQQGGGEQHEASNIEGPASPHKPPTMEDLSSLAIRRRAEHILNGEGPATPRNSVEYHRIPAGDVSSDPEEAHGTRLVASDDAASEDDSAHGEDLDNSTESLASSILKYKKVNDRHYPNEKYEGGYWGAIDEQQRRTQEIYHRVFRELNHGYLCQARWETEDDLKVLDVGTGFGTWATSFGECYPRASVTGVDLVPIQPDFTPQNVKFEIFDIRDQWTFVDQSFDFIHIRRLVGCLTRAEWAVLYSQVFRALKKGGIVEITDADVKIKSDDDTVTPGSTLERWGELLRESNPEAQWKPIEERMHEELIVKAGFQIVSTSVNKVQLSGWPRGNIHHQNVESTIGEAISSDTKGIINKPLHELGWSKEEIEVYCARVRNDLKNPGIRGYCECGTVVGRKPKFQSVTSPAEDSGMPRQPPVRTSPRASPELALVSGGCEIRDIGGSWIRRAVEDAIRRAALEGRRDLDKEIFYVEAMEEWDAIAMDSHQSVDERRMVERTADEVVKSFSKRCVIVNLGCGKSSKALPYIDALLRLGKECVYVAQDLDQNSLRIHLADVTKSHPTIEVIGLWGTFEHTDDYFESQNDLEGPFLFLSLGSIILNANALLRLERLKRLSSYMTKEDRVIIGQDSPAKSGNAKDLAQGLYQTPPWRSFMLKGLQKVDQIIRGDSSIRSIEDSWDVQSRMENASCHEFRAKTLQPIPLANGSILAEGSEFSTFKSYKLTEQEVLGYNGVGGISVQVLCTAPEAGCKQGTMVQYMLSL